MAFKTKSREYVNSKYIKTVERYDWYGTSGALLHYVYVYTGDVDKNGEPVAIGHAYADENEADAKFDEIKIAIYQSNDAPQLILMG